MQPQDALDDLRAIRQIMERARRASGRTGGWFMVLWGIIWLIGFTGTHILVQTGREQLIQWLWTPLNLLGILGSIGLGVWMGRQERKVSSTIWLPILLWWLALAVFDAVLILRFRLFTEGPHMAFLIVLTIALGYVQFGLFTHWAISAIGVFIGLLVIVTTTWLPEYFNLGVAFLGGGALIGGGIGFLRQGE